MDVLGIKIELTISEKFDESDFYTKYQRLKKQIEFLSVQEEYIKDGKIWLIDMTHSLWLIDQDL